MTHNPYQYTPPSPAAPAQPFNGLGLAGFIVSLLGYFTGCILCPVGLLLSFIALFKRPRGFAIAGFILGLIGSIVPLALLLFFGLTIFTIGAAVVSEGMPAINTFTAIVQANRTIDTAASANDYQLPEEEAGNAALAGKKDAWGKPLHYRKLSDREYEIRSAGRDGTLNTSDDLDQAFPVPSRPKPE